MSLAQILGSYDEDYWDFRDVKNSGIHRIANYPAPMVAPMQRELLQLLINENKDYKRMLDPFHGSGVTLVEGQLLGLEVWGIDINPYAHIISLAKLEKYKPHIIETANRRILIRIENIVNHGTVILHSFDNIEKWFRRDVVEDLSVIRNAIQREPNAKTRRYFWLCFGEVVKKYSNTRTSTFKLHIKEPCKIGEMENCVFHDFREKIESTYLLIGYPKKGKSHLSCGDSTDLMKYLKNEYFDLICTSPPYGDNATTVTYGQFSTLQILWIDSGDFRYDPKSVESYSRIDSMSMGGALSQKNAFYYSPILSSYIEKISEHKRRKILRFYSDYENSFRMMSRLLKNNGSMILTLGNRMVDRIEFPFIDINREIAEHYGLKLVHVITRNIVNKRMPTRVSRLADGQPVNSMSKETVLLFKKEA